ncbi:TIM21-domain-containing protein [Mycena amicta]|nr:TIM21-domain-containing protein [Mycena amicta]
MHPCRLRVNPSLRLVRTFATKPPSLLSQTLDQQQDKGTFQLGFNVGQTINRGERIPKWKELSAAGKGKHTSRFSSAPSNSIPVNRSAARTTNFTVIILGASLTGLLLYSLTTELFSSNSPTVLYKNACERISTSQRLARFLDGPPRFYLDPPAAVRPRHRNRHVSSTLRVDGTGREHLFLNFYLQSQPQSPTFLESATAWTQDKFHIVTELSWDEVFDRTRQSTLAAWSRAKSAARYLSGAAPPPPPDSGPTETKQAQAAEQSPGGFMDMFSSLRRPRGTTLEIKSEVEARGQFSEGEVHVAYLRNTSGDFILRYIIVELPNSKTKNPVRVFVERTPGVRDNEPVMHWSSSQH